MQTVLSSVTDIRHNTTVNLQGLVLGFCLVFFLNPLFQMHRAAHISLSIVNYANAVISFALLYFFKSLAT